MANEKRDGDEIERRIDRREFFGIGIGAAAALAALPAASLVSAGCGSGEPDAPAGSPPTTPSEPAAPPAAAAPEPPAPEPAPQVADAGGSEGKLVTEVASAASLVSALQYVNESPKPDQKCGNCQLYTAGAGGRGKCQLFPEGLVAESGHCASWVAKVS
jgi:hypothetical protein